VCETVALEKMFDIKNTVKKSGKIIFVECPQPDAKWHSCSFAA
jgi:hypothetical protein